MYFLIESVFLPIPNDIEVLRNCGQETVVDKTGKVIATGIAMLLKGSRESFRNWLLDKGVVWVSTSPITGKWVGETME